MLSSCKNDFDDSLNEVPPQEDTITIIPPPPHPAPIEKGMNDHDWIPGQSEFYKIYVIDPEDISHDKRGCIYSQYDEKFFIGFGIFGCPLDPDPQELHKCGGHENPRTIFGFRIANVGKDSLNEEAVRVLEAHGFTYKNFERGWIWSDYKYKAPQGKVFLIVTRIEEDDNIRKKGL